MLGNLQSETKIEEPIPQSGWHGIDISKISNLDFDILSSLTRKELLALGTASCAMIAILGSLR